MTFAAIECEFVTSSTAGHEQREDCEAWDPCYQEWGNGLYDVSSPLAYQGNMLDVRTCPGWSTIRIRQILKSVCQGIFCRIKAKLEHRCGAARPLRQQWYGNPGVPELYIFSVRHEFNSAVKELRGAIAPVGRNLRTWLFPSPNCQFVAEIEGYQRVIDGARACGRLPAHCR